MLREVNGCVLVRHASLAASYYRTDASRPPDVAPAADAPTAVIAHIERIADTIGTEPENVRLSMGTALMGTGTRSALANQTALKVACEVGPIEFTSASGEWEPSDVVKHLTADRLREKLEV